MDVSQPGAVFFLHLHTGGDQSTFVRSRRRIKTYISKANGFELLEIRLRFNFNLSRGKNDWISRSISYTYLDTMENWNRFVYVRTCSQSHWSFCQMPRYWSDQNTMSPLSGQYYYECIQFVNNKKIKPAIETFVFDTYCRCKDPTSGLSITLVFTGMFQVWGGND